jgi:hypothetical protein
MGSNNVFCGLSDREEGLASFQFNVDHQLTLMADGVVEPGEAADPNGGCELIYQPST